VRRGNRVIQRLDLYDYLLRGDAAGDIRLEQGDQIYVPLNTRVISVIGQVRRPRIFELLESEGFADLLRFAGDLLPNASVERVQIDRILPPERRAPGFERIKVDVEIKGNLDSLSRVRLLDGDIVQVFSIGDVRRNVVSVSGQVFQPGEFELRPGLTLGRLIDDAQGMLPWALADRVKVIRLLPLTGRTIVHNVDTSTPAGKGFLLEEFDSVEVLDSRVAFPAGTISVEGAVNAPGTRAFAERETLRDAIERSGGVREEAQKVEAVSVKVVVA
jgi:protein involved in polysaccharide export with SLBB domain